MPEFLNYFPSEDSRMEDGLVDAQALIEVVDARYARLVLSDLVDVNWPAEHTLGSEA